MELKAIQHLIETDEKTCARIERHHAQRKQLKDEAEIIKQKMRDEVAQVLNKVKYSAGNIPYHIRNKGTAGCKDTGRKQSQ